MRRTRGCKGGARPSRPSTHKLPPNARLIQSENSVELSNFLQGRLAFVLSDNTQPDCPIVHCSPEFCETTGYPEDEVLGRNCRFLQGQDTDPQAVKTIREACQANKECRVCLLNYKKDGTPFQNILHIMPLMKGNQCTHFIGVQVELPNETVSLCSRKNRLFYENCPNFPPVEDWDSAEAQEAIEGDWNLGLMESSDLFKIISKICTSFVISDAQNPKVPIVFASQGFYDLTGYGASEVIGYNCRFLQGQDTDKDTVAQISEAVQDQRGITTHILNYKKDGTAFWNMLMITPVLNENMNVQYFIGVQMDVTEKSVNEHGEVPTKLEHVEALKSKELMSQIAFISSLLSTVSVSSCPVEL